MKKVYCSGWDSNIQDYSASKIHQNQTITVFAVRIYTVIKKIIQIRSPQLKNFRYKNEKAIHTTHLTKYKTVIIETTQKLQQWPAERSYYNQKTPAMKGVFFVWLTAQSAVIVNKLVDKCYLIARVNVWEWEIRDDSWLVGWFVASRDESVDRQTDRQNQWIVRDPVRWLCMTWHGRWFRPGVVDYYSEHVNAVVRLSYVMSRKGCRIVLPNDFRFGTSSMF